MKAKDIKSLLEKQMWTTYVVNDPEPEDIKYLKERFRIIGYKEDQDFTIEQNFKEAKIYINELMNTKDAVRALLLNIHASRMSQYYDD